MNNATFDITQNLTSFTQPANCSHDNTLETMVIPVLYFITFILGLTLNGFAAWIFLSIPSTSYFVLYLKNVVVADLLMTFTFPFKILFESNLAPLLLRVFVCRGTSVIFYTTMYISIIFLGLISIDRCHKTLQPFARTSSKGLSRQKLLSCLIWITLLSLSTPSIILSNRYPASPNFTCSDIKNKLEHFWYEVVSYMNTGIFWFTLATIAVCYGLISRELHVSYARTQTGRNAGCTYPKKKKVRAKIFLVMGVFAVCFVPFHFTRVPYTMSQTRSLFTCQGFLYQLKETTLWMCSLNVVLDPLIYFFLCRSFRTSLCRTLHLNKGLQHPIPNTASTLQEIPLSPLIKTENQLPMV